MLHIFISYSRGTPYFAESLKGFFENHNYDVWLDLESIQPSKDWEQKIYDAIKNCFVLVVVVTQQAIHSEWILKEIKEAKKQNKDIVPLVMERLVDKNSALSALQISKYQAIDGVNQRKKLLDESLLNTISVVFAEWSRFSPYLEHLQSDDIEEIRKSIAKLGNARLDRATITKRLVKFLDHPSDDIAIEALLALREMADENAVEPLISLINSNRFEDGNEYSILPVNETLVAYETLGLIGGNKVIEFLLHEIEQDRNDLDAIGYQLYLLALTGYAESIDLIIEILEKNLQLSEDNWQAYQFNMKSYFEPLHALAILGDDKCVPTLARFIDRCISLVYAGFDDSDMDRTGRIGDNEDEVPGLFAYELFGELELDTEFARNSSFHVLTFAIEIIGLYSDERAIPALQKVINIQNLDSYNNPKNISWCLEEFVIAAEDIL